MNITKMTAPPRVGDRVRVNMSSFGKKLLYDEEQKSARCAFGNAIGVVMDTTAADGITFFVVRRTRCVCTQCVCDGSSEIDALVTLDELWHPY